jgi:hypothetical protein
MKSMGWFSLANSNWRVDMAATNNRVIWQGVEPNEDEIHQEFRVMLVFNTYDENPRIKLERLYGQDSLGVNIWKPVDCGLDLHTDLLEKALTSLALLTQTLMPTSW